MLAVIGGVDSRPRLGGVVKIDDVGMGTISKITPRGKILVQMNDGNVTSSRLNTLIPVSIIK
jgi:E3 ubiquitin-protein ligase HERC2